MRQLISGLVAAVAVMSASAMPAMACGGGLLQGSCSPCGQAYVSPCGAEAYVPPAPVYSECNSCGGWAHERLPDPEQQYYYVEQGPTYTGPGNFAPDRTYREGSVSGWGGYRHHAYGHGYGYGHRYGYAGHYGYGHRYGYQGGGYAPGYRAHPHFHPWHEHMGYRYSMHPSIRYGYAPHRSLRYGYGAPHAYGYREHALRRYN